MSNEEFLVQFDVLYNNIASNQAPGLNVCEKSMFLTKAEKDIVLSLYNGKNANLEGFEETEELRRYLAPLVAEDTLIPLDNVISKPTGMGSTSNFFELPADLWLITYEAVHFIGGKCDGTNTMQVIPMTQDEYHRLRKNPFRGPNKRRAIRLDMANDLVEIICQYVVEDYYVRYIKKLEPIILEDLPDDLTIDGISVATECMLPEILHDSILERAVELAIQSATR